MCLYVALWRREIEILRNSKRRWIAQNLYFNFTAPQWGVQVNKRTPTPKKIVLYLFGKPFFSNPVNTNKKFGERPYTFMASGFCWFIFWEKVQQRRWTAFLSSFCQLFFLSSVEPRDCSERALWVLVRAKGVTKQLLKHSWFKAVWGGISFLEEHTRGMLCVPLESGEKFFFSACHF